MKVASSMSCFLIHSVLIHVKNNQASRIYGVHEYVGCRLTFSVPPRMYRCVLRAAVVHARAEGRVEGRGMELVAGCEGWGVVETTEEGGAAGDL